VVVSPPSAGAAGSLPAAPALLDPLTDWGIVSRGTAALIQAVLETEAAATVRRRATQATQQLDTYRAQVQAAREREAGRAVVEAIMSPSQISSRFQRVLRNTPADRLLNFHSRRVIRDRMLAAFRQGRGVAVAPNVLRATVRSETDPRLSRLVSMAAAGAAPLSVLAESLAAGALAQGIRRQSAWLARRTADTSRSSTSGVSRRDR
jgi:hypothetical protein